LQKAETNHSSRQQLVAALKGISFGQSRINCTSAAQRVQKRYPFTEQAPN